MRFSPILVAAFLLSSPFPSFADVMKTGSGICHCPGGRYYDRITRGEIFPDLASCLAGGGREPKTGQGACGAASVIGDLPSAPERKSEKYDRKMFGHGWADTDKNCMNTRHEMLSVLSTGRVTTNASGCSVTRGRWLDPYTGRIFVDPSDLDIDHIVPLSYAWARGAEGWDDEKRERFANDPANLLPVDASTNRSKGDDGPLEWLPPNASYRCEYVIRFARISKGYGIAGSESEERGLRRLMSDLCS